jgi:hypothetical protein
MEQTIMVFISEKMNVVKFYKIPAMRNYSLDQRGRKTRPGLEMAG